MKAPHRKSAPSILGPLLASFYALVTASMAAPPDLTLGGVPNENPPLTFNLGPTGARGWAYHVKIDTSESRQILVTEVETGSPASAFLAVDDVILGAGGTGAAPGNFSSDARKSLALAIADAEASTPASLQLIRWRAGNTSTVTLTLQTLGAYTATAPYNCPKSAQILQNGLQYVYNNESGGRYSFGAISLLATGDPAYEAKAQTEAVARIPSQATMDQMMSDERETGSTWERGHTLIFLAEYYLATGDSQVLPAIEAYAVNIAKNQSLFGTMGHIFAEKHPDGSPNGPMGGVYGVVNSAGMPCFLGLLLAKECGLTNPELAPAIEASGRFYAYYTGKGAVPYGEHEPYYQGHETNGKSGLAALCFGLLDNRNEEGKFFAQMATAATNERELGHTGAFFNYLWSPLGAAAGGEEAAAAHFSRISWLLDLNRRWDGGFDYDCLNGEGPNSGSEYNDFRMSTAALLTYALPHRKLHVTGKGHDPTRWLSSAEVTAAVQANDYDADPRSNAELISDLGNWSPKVRLHAAKELGTRIVTPAERNQITAMANDPSGDSRPGACLALGEIGDSSSAAPLAALLTDPDHYVRYSAAEAMRYLPNSAKLAELDTILDAADSTATPLYPMDEEDPLHFAHGKLSVLLFYSGNAYGPKGVIWGSGINGVDRNLLYPAIRAVAETPIGFSRSTLNATYDNLTYDDVLAVSGTIVDSISNRAPADKMFSNGVRSGGVAALYKFGIAEGVPTCMIYAANEAGGRRNDPLQRLGYFAGGVRTVLPDPETVSFLESYLNDGETAATAQASLDAINADTDPTPLVALKSIQSATADDPTLTLPARSTTLRVVAVDHAQGDSIFTWRKISGPGAVSFSHNGTAAAATNTLRFAGTPGTYQFEVTMSDSRALTEAYETVTVQLVQGSGPDVTPPNPDPMTWASPPTVVSDTEVTMTATTASDPSGVEYYFTSTAGGGRDSGWQDSPSYTDIGLAPGTQHTYTVTARDKSANQNTTGPSAAASATTGGTAPPLKIFIMAGQSNMEGHGERGPVGTQGTLEYQVNTDPSTYGHLHDGVDWTIRSDAWIWYERGGTTLLSGELSAGYGANANTIGPELQFGHEMGNSHGEQVLIIKTAWGGKSLYVDFRPPSSGWSVNPPVAEGDQGYFYQEMLNNVNDVLTNLATYFPDYNPANGYELAGFGWHQGWNDRVNQAAVDEYEVNMENFINDVRTDLNAPNLPFVIANTGMGGWAETNARALKLMNAQLAMEDYGKYPAFDGNVAVVETRPFYYLPGVSPSDQSYHWNRNAKTYFEIGQAMALELQALITGADTQPPTPNPGGFAVPPAADSDTVISMTAAAGSDISGPVEYLFTETTGNAGGTSSGWQTSATYLDTGLMAETVYSYTVTMRDSLGNTGTASAAASAATMSYLDIFPPTPNPASFAVAPTASSDTSISMTATAGTDETGPIEYLFTETSGNPGGTSSGWQTYAQYTDTGLSPGTTYTYTVTLRDGMGNAGSASAPASATAVNAAGEHGILDMSVTNGGINPVTGQAWQVGDQYRVAFVSAATRDATSPDIADYHAFAQATAAAVGWGGATWRCVGQSYNNPDAKVNSGTTTPGGVGIFLPNGVKIADDHSDLWDGSIDAKWNVTETGGTWSNSVASGSLRKFGDPGETKIEHGNSDRVNSTWWQVFNGNQTSQWHFYIISDAMTVQAGSDIDPPTPNQASFAVTPAADGDHSISMTAATGSDPTGPVEYFFAETSGNPGGADSGWQPSPSYTNSGLSASTQYTYTVTMRDAIGNTGSTSAPSSAATTGPDIAAPNPDPMTWAVLPVAGGNSLLAHEGFDYPAGSDLTGNGGTGFDAPWTTSRSLPIASYFVVNSTGLTFTDASTNVLPVSGNSAHRTSLVGQSEANRVLSAEARAAMLADGSTLWFSVLHHRTVNNEHAGFVLGTGTFDVASSGELTGYTPGGEGFGFGSSGNQWIGAIGYDDSTGLAKVDSSVDATTTRLIIGKIDWNANGSNDTLTLYNVTDLMTTPTTPIATLSADLAQSNFDRVSLLSNEASAVYDEIRFGTSFASVVGRATGNSETTIDMIATTATDATGVEYYFTELSGNPGGNDSGWQSSPNYSDTGLQSGTQYTYTVMARDTSTNQNTTAPSAAASATTTGTPPPDPTPYATWAGTAGIIGDFGGDDDGDGTLNGHEWYFFNSDPQVTGSHDSPITPVVATGPDTFAFTHVRPKNRADVTETYQWSGDLFVWYAADGSATDGTHTVTVADKTVVAGPHANHETVTLEATVSDPGMPELFFRLKLSNP